jgi:hypothetical protein
MAEDLGWQILRDLFIQNGLTELADTIVNVAQDAGADAGSATIYEALRNTQVYKDRFKGNFARLDAGKTILSEAEYLYQEKQYEQTMLSYQAGGLATRDNFANLIAGDVSVTEVAERFSGAYSRVTKAVNSNDKALVDELRKLYPGVTDNEIANSLILGSEGSKYLNNKIDIADIRAAETEAGIKSTFGAERLAAEGLNRSQARIGLSRVAAAKGGLEQASSIFGETSTEGIQQELESENLLGIQSKRNKRLASQQRGQYSGQSGIKTGSLNKKAQV